MPSLAATLAIFAVALAELFSPATSSPRRPATASLRRPATRSLARKATRSSQRRQDPVFAVGERTLTFVDTSRTVRFPGHPPEPRTLVTVIRYPAQGPVSGTDLRGAAPARGAGPFPLIVFGHGFAVTPATYATLLQAWAREGYVVAAPVFPLGNANAPGGPNESDIINQPRDMSFVISRMIELNANPRSSFASLIASREIAVAGQSDGGETALAAAYDTYYRDRRIRAAAILSGARIPGVGGFDFPVPSPPLLATQGTADTTNFPSSTFGFFDLAPRPKFLLLLIGASHLPPYTDQQPQLSIVERVTTAFFDRYLKNGHGDLKRMIAAGNAPRLATLQADP